MEPTTESVQEWKRSKLVQTLAVAVEGQRQAVEANYVLNISCKQLSNLLTNQQQNTTAQNLV